MKNHLLRRSARRGTALVEMALVLLILFYLTFGTIEYGWMFLKEQQLTNACEEAARVAALVGTTQTSQVSSIFTQQLTNAGWSNPAVASLTISPAVNTVTKGNSITVSTSVNYSDIEVVSIGIIPLPTTISASSTMVKEGS